ncbi:MAG: hypothetical protein ACLFP2_01100 [Candidatus Woesearchaeota archaeon]
MKKGQIGIFIIIGLIILMSMLVLFFMRHQTETFIPSAVVPPNVEPAKRYIDTCIKENAEMGITIMGMQGGYIDLPEEIERVRPSYIGFGSRAVIKTPHWYFNDEVRIPSLQFMELELADYINDSMDECKKGLRDFRHSFEITTYEPTVNVSFGGRETVVKVDYPLEFKNKVTSEITRMRSFGAVLPVRMKKVHQLANLTAHKQIDERFLENLTMEMMTSDFSFPFSGIEFKCGSIKWQVSELKERLSNIMHYNLGRIKIKNTNHTPFEAEEEVYEEFQEKRDILWDRLLEADYSKGDPFDDAMKDLDFDEKPSDMYEYTHFYFDVGNSYDNRDLRVFFSYNPEWDMDFKPTPSDGGVMSTKQMKGESEFLRFLCMNMYHFTYDVSYPVQIKVIDPESFPYKGGYTFSFGVPVMIEENEAVEEKMNVRTFDAPVYMEEFCGIRSGDYKIQVKGYDEYNQMGLLKDVNLSYECMNKYCEVGNTSFQDSTYKYQGELPSNCANPIIRARKEGYLDGAGQMTGDALTIEMEKLKDVDVSFKKYIYYSSSDELKEGEIDNNDSFTLRVSHPEHDQYYHYPLYGSPIENLSFILKGGKYDFNVINKRDGDVVGGYYGKNITVPLMEEKNEIVIPVIEYRPFPITETQQGEMMVYLYEEDYEVKPVFR